MLDSNQSGTWKQTEPNKTAKESLSRPSRYFWICIDIYINFFTSQVSFLIHTLRHSSDQCFRCAVIHPSRLQFAVPPANPSCCHRQLTTQISPSSLNRNAPPSSFHLAPRLHLLRLLHLPSAIPLTHPRHRRAHFHGRGRTSRRLSILFQYYPGLRSACPCLTMCVSFNDVTSGAVHIHPRCHPRGLSLRRDGHTGVRVQGRLLRADPHRLADQHVTPEG